MAKPYSNQQLLWSLFGERRRHYFAIDMAYANIADNTFSFLSTDTVSLLFFVMPLSSAPKL
jgi:hypothetical protein